VEEKVWLLWNSIQARNWDTVRSLLHDKFILELPQSGEQFDIEGYLTMNQEYPGDWSIQVLRVSLIDASVVSEIRVLLDDHTDWAVSFINFQEEKIFNIREYWAEAFPVPNWRMGMSLPNGHSNIGT